MTHLEKYQKVATIVSAIVGAAALLFAAITYQKNSELQREAITIQIFRDYSMTRLEYPEFALGYQVDLDSVPSTQKEKYFDFADYSLYTGETILTMNEGDSAWIGTVRGIIETHSNYILSDEFPEANYSEQMKSLIKKTLPEFHYNPH